MKPNEKKKLKIILSKLSKFLTYKQKFKNFFREMLEEKEADQFKNWSEASKKLKDDDRFTKAPDDEKREWYISFLKTQELEGKY